MGLEGKEVLEGPQWAWGAPFPSNRSLTAQQVTLIRDEDVEVEGARWQGEGM